MAKLTISFEQDAERVLQGLRSAFTDVLLALPRRTGRSGEEPFLPGGDKKLVWRMMRLVEDEDLYAAAQLLPGGEALNGLLRAVGKTGVPAKTTARLSEAIDDFKRLIEAHAGDRATLDTMLVGRATQDYETFDLNQRRAAFRAARHGRGVELAVHYSAHFLAPGKDPANLDMATIAGFFNLRQLRERAVLPVHTIRWQDMKGNPSDGKKPKLEALDSSNAMEPGFGIVSEFSTKPLPKLRVLPSRPDEVKYEVTSSGLGLKHSISYVRGQLARGRFPRYRDEANPYGALAVGVKIPTETMILDLHMHESAYEKVSPRAFVFYDDIAAMGSMEMLDDERYQLPIRVNVQNLGRDPARAQTLEVPQYLKMAEYVCERAGWKAKEFNIFRCRVEYPPMPSTLLMRYEVPEK
ncbi:MAG: hypothetical protein ACREJD_05600 [Phycisphaerales bacterium]